MHATTVAVDLARSDFQIAATTVGNFKQFCNGTQFGAWLGLTPRQNASGDKNHLGGITHRGDMCDMYLRTLRVQGAKSVEWAAMEASPTNPMCRRNGGDHHGSGTGPHRAVGIWGHTTQQPVQQARL